MRSAPAATGGDTSAPVNFGPWKYLLGRCGCGHRFEAYDIAIRSADHRPIAIKLDVACDGRMYRRDGGSRVTAGQFVGRVILPDRFLL